MRPSSSAAAPTLYSLAAAPLAALLSLIPSRSCPHSVFVPQCFALGYNLTAVPLASGALYPLTRVRLHPAVAGLCMALSSVSVVASSLLLRRYRPPVLPSGAGVQEVGECDGAAGDLEGGEGTWAWRRMLWGEGSGEVGPQSCSNTGDALPLLGSFGEEGFERAHVEREDGAAGKRHARAMTVLRPSAVAAKVRGYSKI